MVRQFGKKIFKGIGSTPSPCSQLVQKHWAMGAYSEKLVSWGLHLSVGFVCCPTHNPQGSTFGILLHFFSLFLLKFASNRSIWKLKGRLIISSGSNVAEIMMQIFVMRMMLQFQVIAILGVHWKILTDCYELCSLRSSAEWILKASHLGS